MSHNIASVLPLPLAGVNQETQELHIRKALSGGPRKCNTGDTDSGKTKSSKEEKESGMYKGKSHKVVKVFWQKSWWTLMQERDIFP